MNLYSETDYRKVITNLVGAKSGLKIKLSQHMGCQPSYLTRVLKGQADLNQDQLLSICSFFQFDLDQTEYLLCVLLENRSAKISTKKFFKTKITQISEKALQLKKQLKAESKLSEEFEDIYYSSWIYSAIHISLLSPSFDEKKISEHFGVKLQDTLNALNKLELMGLIIKKNNRWQVVHTNTHLGSDSSWLSRHHMNWRIKLTEKMSRNDLNGLHYSSIACCSKEDKILINQILLEALQKCRELIKKSKNETVFYYGLDFFNLFE